jgi:hypothetical protein
MFFFRDERNKGEKIDCFEREREGEGEKKLIIKNLMVQQRKQLSLI